MTTVIKITGHYLDDDALLLQFANTVATLEQPVVIIHGGGKEITQLQEKLSIEPRYVDGLRVTDQDSLALVEMVLCGTVNKRLVRYLLSAGLDAQGMSGVDRGLIRATKMSHKTVDMQFTGTVVAIRESVVFDMLERGITPVIAPVSLGEDSSLNVNGDPVTGAIASAISADKVIFISNVAGVLVNETIAPTLTLNQANVLIADGTIFGGMIPKVKTALDVLESGVPQVVITNLEGLASQSGTVFVSA